MKTRAPRPDERARQAEIDAARAREIEEERLTIALKVSSASLPDVGAPAVGTAITARVVRDYIRNLMLPASVKRLFDIGMGIAKFDTVVSGAGGTAVLRLEAPATVQAKALAEIIGIGVPKLRGGMDGDGSPIFGVMVLGQLGDLETPGLDEARRRASMQRMEDHGVVGGPSPGRIGAGAYVPPPGHAVHVIEDDLSGGKAAPSPDDPPRTPRTPRTKAQEFAARRRTQTNR